MDNQLEMAQNKFIESVGRISDVFGINRSVAQLYTFLYLRQKPLSLDEIAEAVGASKGNVSVNIRILEKWGAVRNLWIKGSRKDYYEAEQDIKKVLSGNLRAAVEKRLSEVSSMIEEFNAVIQSSKGSLSEADKKMAKLYEDRLSRINGLRKLVSGALTLADKLL